MTAPEPIDAAAVRARHRKLRTMQWCATCRARENWPCDAIRLLDALEACQNENDGEFKRLVFLLKKTERERDELKHAIAGGDPNGPEVVASWTRALERAERAERRIAPLVNALESYVWVDRQHGREPLASALKALAFPDEEV